MRCSAILVHVCLAEALAFAVLPSLGGEGAFATVPVWDAARDAGKVSETLRAKGAYALSPETGFDIPAGAIRDYGAFTVTAKIRFTAAADNTVLRLFDQESGETGWSLTILQRRGWGNPVRLGVNGVAFGAGRLEGKPGKTYVFTVTARKGVVVAYRDGVVQGRFLTTVTPASRAIRVAAAVTDRSLKPIPGVELLDLRVFGSEEEYYAPGEPRGFASGFVGGKGWSVKVPANAGDERLPRLLYYGDSISHGYSSSLEKLLGKKVRLYHWSGFVYSPTFPTNVFRAAASVAPFDAIVFNNGLHSLHDAWRRASDARIRSVYRDMVRTFRQAAPSARLHYLETTPVTMPKAKSGVVESLKEDDNAMVCRLNRLADEVMEEEGVPVIPGYDLLRRHLAWAAGDTAHWTRPAYDLLAAEVGRAVAGDPGFADAPLRTLAEDFANPPQSRGAYAWWHWAGGAVTKEGITRDLEAMKSAGLAGATIFHDGSGRNLPIQTNFVYHSKVWWDFLAFASREAKRLGLSVGMQNCPGYSASGGPWITPELAMKKLVCSTNDAPPETNLGFYRDIVTIVTNGVRYRIGYTCTGKRTHPAPQCATPSLEADKLSRQAMEFNWDHVFNEMPRRLALGTPGFNHVMMDSYEARTCDWTENYARAFKERRGYDPVPLLPILFGADIGTKELQKKFRADMVRTMQDLFTENHFKTFYRRAHAIGLETHVEPYGNGNFDGRGATAWCDVPYTCFWATPVYWSKDRIHFGAAAGSFGAIARAHGRDLVGCEAFTCLPSDDMWTFSPRRMKKALDATYARGVNLMALHHWVHQPLPSLKPGFSMGYWGVHFGQCQSWFETGKDFYRYMSRCQALLQRGREQDGAVRILEGGGSGPNDVRSYAGERCEKGTYFAFVCNSMTNRNAIKLAMLNPSDAPAQVWFPATGRRFAYPASATARDGKRTVLTLPLAPLESAFVVFAPAERDLPALDLNEGQWRRGGEKAVAGLTLRIAGRTFAAAEGKCWTTFDDPSVRHFSGEATYTGTLELSDAVTEDAWLDLGTVRDVAEVFVNGRRAGAVWYEPFRVFAGGLLKRGVNAIEIRVANTWANRLIGDSALPRDYAISTPQKSRGGDNRMYPIGAAVVALPDWALGKAPRTSGRTTFSIWDYYPDGGELQPSGLLSPIRLVIPSQR